VGREGKDEKNPLHCRGELELPAGKNTYGGKTNPKGERTGFRDILRAAFWKVSLKSKRYRFGKGDRFAGAWIQKLDLKARWGSGPAVRSKVMRGAIGESGWQREGFTSIQPELEKNN